MKAVVTGASGVVGTALLRTLVREGDEVLAILRPGSSNNAAVRAIGGVTVAEHSVEDLRDFRPPQGKNWDVFFHLGWTGTKGASRYDPVIHTKNVGYALDAVELAERMGCGLFIGAGSQAEYGRKEEALRPDTPVSPESAYGIGKLAAGMMTRTLAEMKGMRHIWTRILSVYGPGDAASTLVTGFISSLLKGERPVTTAGEQIWDYLYSDDAAAALAAIAARGRSGQTYLIASGQARSLRSYIEEMRDVISPGADIGFGEVPYAARQVMYLTADISGTTADTGWRPETSFAEGVRRTALDLRERGLA